MWHTRDKSLHLLHNESPCRRWIRPLEVSFADGCSSALIRVCVPLQFDMQQLSLDELKQVLFHAFRDHLTMKDIENIIITEEESLNETSGNCPEYEGGEEAVRTQTFSSYMRTDWFIYKFSTKIKKKNVCSGVLWEICEQLLSYLFQIALWTISDWTEQLSLLVGIKHFVSSLGFFLKVSQPSRGIVGLNVENDPNYLLLRLSASLINDQSTRRL